MVPPCNVPSWRGAPAPCAALSPRTEPAIFKDIVWGPAGPLRLPHARRPGTGLLQPIVGWLMASTTDRSLTRLGLAALSCVIPAQPRSSGQHSQTGRPVLTARSYCAHSVSPRDSQRGTATMTVDVTNVTKGDWDPGVCIPGTKEPEEDTHHTPPAGSWERETRTKREFRTVTFKAKSFSLSLSLSAQTVNLSPLASV